MKSFNFRINEDLYATLDRLFGSKIDRTKPWNRADVVHVAVNYAIAKAMAVPTAGNVKDPVAQAGETSPAQRQPEPVTPPRYPPLVRPHNNLPPPVPLVPENEMGPLIGDDHGMGL